MMTCDELSGRRVLLVEDEALISMLGEDILSDAGCEVVIAMRLAEALALAAAEDLHLAILDVNLGNEASYPVAEVLTRRQIPFIFATGYGAAGLREGFADRVILQKPYDPRSLISAAVSALS